MSVEERIKGDVDKAVLACMLIVEAEDNPSRARKHSMKLRELSQNLVENTTLLLETRRMEKDND